MKNNQPYRVQLCLQLCRSNDLDQSLLRQDKFQRNNSNLCRQAALISSSEYDSLLSIMYFSKSYTSNNLSVAPPFFAMVSALYFIRWILPMAPREQRRSTRQTNPISSSSFIRICPSGPSNELLLPRCFKVYCRRCCITHNPS